MNKRGQIYIIAVLILGFILFSLLVQPNFVNKNIIDDDFETLSKNFDVESTRFINEYLKSNNIDSQVLITEFGEFSRDFSNYARNQNPDFEVIFILRRDGDILIGNFMDENIQIGNNQDISGCYTPINNPTSVAGSNGNIRLNVCSNSGSIDATNPNSYIQIVLYPMNPLIFYINDIRYSVDIHSLNKPEIIIVGQEDKGEQRRVYMEHGFVSGERYQRVDNLNTGENNRQ